MSNYQTEIEKDLKWREDEISSLKFQVRKFTQGTITYNSLLRALVCLLYSHYEGFTKFAWTIYIQELEKLNIPVKNVNDKIASFALSKEFNHIKNNFNEEQIYQFCIFDFSNLINSNLNFNGLVPDAESNLWPNLFIDNCKKIGLNSNEIVNKKVQIKELVGRRNQIAHGEKMLISNLNDYIDMEDAALNVMHDLAVNIIDTLDNNLFLKRTSP